MAVFQEGYALEASMKGDVLAVPLIVDRPVPRWLKSEERRFRQLSRALRVTGRMNFKQLQAVSFDYNDQHRWFDLRDTRGQSLRLVFGGGAPTEPEREVLRALRVHVEAAGLAVDHETEVALGVTAP